MDSFYVINYLIMLLLAYLYWKSSNKKYIRLAFILQFVFIAFRAPVVGADTWDYIRYLDGERNFYNNDSRELEIGFQIYRQILVSLHGNRFVYMVINTLLTCYPVYLLIKKYSYNPPLSLALVAIFNLYYLYFCGLRQILGLAILFMCIIYFLNDGKRKYLIYVFGTALGYLFHTSIIIYSLIFAAAFLIKHTLTKKIIIVGVVLSALTGVILQTLNIGQIFNFILSLNFSATERLQGYLENENMNVISSIFFTLRPSITAIIIFGFIDREKVNHLFTSIYFIGVILGNLFVSVPMIGRLIQGLTIFGPIVFTWIFSEKYYKILNYRKYVNIILIIFFLYFSQMYVKNNLNSNIDLTNASRMHPYQFIWEDYRNHLSIRYFD